MRAGEFATDNEARLLWTLPAERSKNKRSRITPIVGMALEIIAARLDGYNAVMFGSEPAEPLYSGLSANIFASGGIACRWRSFQLTTCAGRLRR